MRPPAFLYIIRKVFLQNAPALRSISLKKESFFVQKIKQLLPGLGVCLAISIPAWLLGKLVPVVGGAVFSILIGMVIALFWSPKDTFKPGVTFVSKKVLQAAVVLLGFGLNLSVVLETGKQSLPIILCTISTSLLIAFLLHKLLRIDGRISTLIGVGSSICGGSAIAAIAPVIEATDLDVAYGMSATFLFDMAMIVLFPIMGRALGLSDAAYGLWAGTAVNDTSSVVAAGYAFSEKAGDFATMVKLTRTLAIIPTVLVFALISAHLKKKQAAEGQVKVNMKSVFPWFIPFFVAMSLLSSAGLVPAALAAGLKTVSKFLMVMALAAIGLNTSFAEMKKSGIKPMLHGFIISLLVVLVAITVEFAIGVAPNGTLV